MNAYYVVYLKDGRVLYFDKQCNKVNYNDSRLCVFFDDYKKRCLAMVPYENILYISVCYVEE